MQVDHSLVASPISANGFRRLHYSLGPGTSATGASPTQSVRSSHAHLRELSSLAPITQTRRFPGQWRPFFETEMLKFGESKNLAGEGPASNANLPIASGATPLAIASGTSAKARFILSIFVRGAADPVPGPLVVTTSM